MPKVDAATRANAIDVLLDDDFWDGVADSGSSARPWPWEIASFDSSQSYSAVRWYRLYNLTRVGFDAAPQPHRRTPTHSQLAGTQSLSRLAQLGLGYSLTELRLSHREHCGHWIHVHSGLRSCERAPAFGVRTDVSIYCAPSSPGAYDNALSSRYFLAATSRYRASVQAAKRVAAGREQGVMACGTPPGSCSLPRVRVVWHLRTPRHGIEKVARGEVCSDVAETDLHKLNASVIGPALGARLAEHVVLTANATFFRHHWPTLAPAVVELHERDAVHSMAEADILVSAGSSFAVAAAAVAPDGQL